MKYISSLGFWLRHLFILIELLICTIWILLGKFDTLSNVYAKDSSSYQSIEVFEIDQIEISKIHCIISDPCKFLVYVFL